MAVKKKAKKSASGVIELDLNKVEVREVYDGDDPRPGFYNFECVNAGTHTSQGGAEGFKWIFVLRDHPEYEGWTRTVYSNLDSTKWKTEEIMLALKGGKAVQGTKAANVRLDMSDPDSVRAFLKKAKLVRGRVQRDRDSDPDDPSYDLGKIIALDEAKMAARKAAQEALEDDEDDDEFDDADSEFEDADEDEDTDDEEDEDEEDSDEEDDEDSDDEDDSDSDDDDDDEDEDFDEDDEGEDEEEEPEPPKKATKKAAASKPAKAASKKAAPKDEVAAKRKAKAAKKK